MSDHSVIIDDFLEREAGWEDICCHISLHLSRLTRLDLRVQRAVDVESQHTYPLDLLKSMQTQGDFPSKRREELALLQPHPTITVSWAFGWLDFDLWSNDIVKLPLFDPLRPSLAKGILRIRERTGLLALSDDARQSFIMDFWKLRRKQRPNMAYLHGASEISNGKDDEANERDEIIDELETEIKSGTHQNAGCVTGPGCSEHW